MTFSEPYTPYCGLEYNDLGQPVRVTTAPHVAVTAPTRAGKTRRILGPAAVLHPGPLFSCSSKPDLARLVIPHRVNGPIGVLDLSPVKTDTWPSDVRSMVSDPTAAITTADEALTVAETMLALHERHHRAPYVGCQPTVRHSTPTDAKANRRGATRVAPRPSTASIHTPRWYQI
jgi:hypothetical protein